MYSIFGIISDFKNIGRKSGSESMRLSRSSACYSVRAMVDGFASNSSFLRNNTQMMEEEVWHVQEMVCSDKIRHRHPFANIHCFKIKGQLESKCLSHNILFVMAAFIYLNLR